MTKKKNAKRMSPRIRYAVWGLAIIVTIAAIGFFSYYAIQNSRRVERYNRALTAFDRGDYDKAEQLLLACMRDDRNNEAALVKLAELYEKRHRWHAAARYWRAARGLNALEPRYTNQLLEAQKKSRSYEDLIRTLADLPASRLAPHTSWLAYAEFAVGNREKAESLLATLPADSADDEKARYVRFILKASTEKPDQKTLIDTLTTFSHSPDQLVAMEALLALAGQYGNNDAAREETLKRAVELNPEFAALLLAEFYFDRGRYADACRFYQMAMGFQLPLNNAIRYGEALFQENNIKELKALAEVFRRGDKSVLMTGYYLDALTAYLEEDIPALGKNLKLLDHTFRSPVAVMTIFSYGLSANDAPMTMTAIAEFKKRGDYREIYPTVLERVRPMLANLYARQEIVAAAPLAEMLQDPVKPDLLLTRIILLNKTVNSYPTHNDIRTALEHFPDDPVILNIAIGGAMRAGQFNDLLILARRGLASGSDSLELLQAELLALEALGQIDEAAQKFAALYAKHPNDPVLAKKYLAFIIRQNQEALLAPLAKEFAASTNAEIAAMTALIEGEQAFRSGKKAEMVTKFTSPTLNQALNISREADWELLYFIAIRLAEADAIEPAIAIYEKLKPVLPNRTLIQMNLSELYAASGRKADALNEARAAWVAYPQTPVVRLCYGLRLFESGNYKEALNILDPLMTDADKDVRLKDAWTQSLEKLIVQSFDGGKYSECIRYSDLLLAKNPGDKIAVDYRAQATDLQKKAAAGEKK